MIPDAAFLMSRDRDVRAADNIGTDDAILPIWHRSYVTLIGTATQCHLGFHAEGLLRSSLATTAALTLAEQRSISWTIS